MSRTAKYCAEHNHNYDGDECPEPSPQWLMRSVGCHYTHPDYPNAVISTTSGPIRPDHSHFSGYTAYINRQCVGIFARREEAQSYVEANYPKHQPLTR